MGRGTRKRRKRKNPGAQPRPAAPSKCRDCGHTVTVHRYEFFKAARPRCPACGGALDYQGSWNHTR